MTLEAHSNLVLAVTRVLYVNGQSTHQVVGASKRLSDCLRFRATLFPRWGELALRAEDATQDSGVELLSAVEAIPTGVDMHHVASTMRLVDAICEGRMPPQAAGEGIARIAAEPPVATWLFALAAAIGAVALAVLFGVNHRHAGTLIFISAGLGGVLRRVLARHSKNIFIQPFAAALVAGAIGAVAVRYNISSSLRLVAVCPCMVLVPGPHFLNGMLDLVRGRLNLGAARILYAVLVVVAISTGLLLGLALLGASLPIDPAPRGLPLWHDAIAAGIAVACYSIFYSTPWRMFAWPVVVGTFAHAVRWVALTHFGAGATVGSFLACLVVGTILGPVSRRWHMPFAAIGFASVVSMIPGVLMFRMASGLVQLSHGVEMPWELMAGTLADGSSATIIVLAMSVGLIVPKLLLDYVSDSLHRPKP